MNKKLMSFAAFTPLVALPVVSIVSCSEPAALAQANALIRSALITMGAQSRNAQDLHDSLQVLPSIGKYGAKLIDRKILNEKEVWVKYNLTEIDLTTGKEYSGVYEFTITVGRGN